MAGFTDRSFSREDPTLVWVAADTEAKGAGTYEQPFESIPSAIKKVRPGQTVVLKKGVYTGDLTFEISGSVEHPIRITSETPGAARIDGACWFFYDVSDMIVTDLTFTNSLRGAIAVIGNCRRNRFAGIRFLDCGDSSGTSCTLFFGGGLGRCNLVENNSFERMLTPPRPNDNKNDVCIGVMISEGNPEENQPIKDYIVRNNTFKNYTFGILVGTKDNDPGEYGHIVEFNTITGCSADGIAVKCGDTTIRGNILDRCSRHAIMASGKASVIEDNRILDSTIGISAGGTGHTVQNNCVVRCREQAIVVSEEGAEQSRVAAIMVEQNTCVDCGTASLPDTPDSSGVAGVLIKANTSCVLRKNIFHGKGLPYEFSVKTDEKRSDVLIGDNVSSGGCEVQQGSKAAAIEFARFSEDNFENNSEYGAKGWNAGPEPFDPSLVTSALDERQYLDTYLDAPEGEIESLINDIDRDEIMRRSYFFNPGGTGE